MTNLPISLDNLPISMIDLAETLGLRIALRLMQEWGGCEMSFPKVPGPDHRVVHALGEADAQAVCAYLGGSVIYIPHGRAPRSARAAVLDLQSKNLTRAEIARTLGISQRHVRRVANGSDPDIRQPGLFDLGL